EAVTEGIIPVKSQSSPLLRVGRLKSGITAVGVRAKLIHISKTLIEWLLVGVRSKTSIAHRLVAIELHLERLMESPCAYEINPQASKRANLLIDAKVVLVVIGCL